MALTDPSGRRNRKDFAELLRRSCNSSVSVVTKLVAGGPQEWGRLSAEYIRIPSLWPFQQPIQWVLGTVSV
jgi:hypothetical protein